MHISLTIQADLTNSPVWPSEFVDAYAVPDARQPVSQYREHGHQEGQYHETVLRIPVQFLQQTCQAQQPGDFQQMESTLLNQTANNIQGPSVV